ncbi:MAG: YggS family pyridoxal phosphate-dependent enzyme [Capsulimonadaceae bacterium]
MEQRLRENLHALRRRIAAASERAGRSQGDVCILAVSKGQPITVLQAAVRAGLNAYGENYVRNATIKKAELPGRFEWHLIGHLQTNKARPAVVTFDVVHTVDSRRVAVALGSAALDAGKVQRVLIQVKLSADEPEKTGASAESVPGLVESVGQMPNLCLEGLMGVAPRNDDPRPHFRKLRTLFDQLPESNRRTLSMGMSSDFEVAIEEGATLIRIGAALFGPRP